MRDYLANLAARSLERTPVIQPRLASLFEPLGLVGPLFPGPGRGDRFETIAARDEGAPDAQPQSRADHGTEPARSSLSAVLLKTAKETSDPPSSQALPPVSDQQLKPVVPTTNLAEPESRSPKETDDLVSRDQIVSTSRPSEGAKAKIVVPVIGVAVSSERFHHDEPSRPEKVSEAAKNEFAVAVVADAGETRRPEESTRSENKLVKRRDSESLNESNAEDSSNAITSRSQSYQPQSSLPGLAVPRTTSETIPTDRGPRPPVSIPETAVRRGPTAIKPIADIKPRRDSGLRSTGPADEGPSESENQPRISVTIGRIEIRAQLPPASRPSTKGSNAPKLMGLDDYLRQRAQGGKR
jgi:hypothetical protein